MIAVKIKYLLFTLLINKILSKLLYNKAAR